jgi:hypothetical protein
MPKKSIIILIYYLLELLNLIYCVGRNIHRAQICSIQRNMCREKKKYQYKNILIINQLAVLYN